MSDEAPPYLLARHIVTRVELFPGVGPLEAGIILIGGAGGFGLRWVLGLVVRALPAAMHGAADALTVARFVALLGGAGVGFRLTRPTPGGSVLDDGRAMRHWVRSQKLFCTPREAMPEACPPDWRSVARRAQGEYPETVGGHRIPGIWPAQLRAVRGGRSEQGLPRSAPRTDRASTPGDSAAYLGRGWDNGRRRHRLRGRRCT